MTSSWASLWTLEPGLDFLNHGSFGACPRAVIERQRDWQRRLERDPVAFVVFELERELDEARRVIAAFIDAEPSDLVFVNNTTTGVNTVLDALPLEAGDEILVTDHGYGACTNAARRRAAEVGAAVVVASVPFPLGGAGEVTEAVLRAVTDKTRVALIDHVTSPSALVLPIEELVRELRARGVKSLIDGAHAPGMLPVSLRGLGADYYTGNLHKWCCAPKGAAFLWARAADQARLHPLVTSHGASSSRTDRSRFLLEFDWTGTDDPSAFLSAAFALQYLEGLMPGGWPRIRERNRELVLAARHTLSARLGLPLPCPDDMVGSMATLPLGPDAEAWLPNQQPFVEPLYSQLSKERFQVVISGFPRLPERSLRICAHLYNDAAQFERLASSLARVLGRS